MAASRTGLTGRLAGGLIARLCLFPVVVALVWITYVWLYAMHPDLLGWIYATLRPVTIWFYGLIDTRLPDAIKYKASAGLSDELGPRALFLLILGGIIETVVLGLWHGVRALVGPGRDR
jgi:hypothetical protein